MTVEQAIAVVIESLSGARYAEGMAALSVIRSHIDREVVVTDEMAQAAIDEWFDTGFKFEGEHIPRMKAALIAALEVDRA